MTKSSKRLALSTQTVHVLDASALARAQGGKRSQCSYDYSGCIATERKLPMEPDPDR